MTKIEIYTTNVCPYCVKAKNLLQQKGVDYIEYNLNEKPELMAEMQERANGARTVPQIFIDNNHIGGCDDIYAMQTEGKLDSMLGDAINSKSSSV